jgi:hypothetical protein
MISSEFSQNEDVTSRDNPNHYEICRYQYALKQLLHYTYEQELHQIF